MQFLIASTIQNAVNFFAHGGIFMGFLLLLSVVSVTIIILRGVALREKNVLPPELIAEVERLEPGSDLDNLKKLLKVYPSPLARVLDVLIKHLSWSRSEAIEAVQVRARHEVARLEKGLVILEITTGVAPLLGLLGTLSGLVGIFAAVGSDSVAVARGIAEALNTTIMGLAVAAPSLIFFSHFQRRIEVMSIELEALVADLLGKCYSQGESPRIERIEKIP
jgi:biopolymer transport protein ExbB